MNRSCVVRFAMIGVLFSAASRASAVGWGPTDFLVGGGPNFPNKIGVFDANFNYKGLLDPSFLTVQGMDFDAAGNLVAVAPSLDEVRVYDSSGARVGGFVSSDMATHGAFDLKVAPDGSYITAYSQNFIRDGAAQFSPQGALLQRYGHDNVRGVAVIPGNRVWLGGPSPVVKVLDITSGKSIGSVSVPGMLTAQSMQYSVATDTVLLVDTASDAIFEATVAGAFVRRFDAPGNPLLGMVTRGPSGDVFATTGGSQSILRWRSDGSLIGSVSTSGSVNGVLGILWAGSIPEPNNVFLGAVSLIAIVASRCRRTQISKYKLV